MRVLNRVTKSVAELEVEKGAIADTVLVNDGFNGPFEKISADEKRDIKD